MDSDPIVQSSAYEALKTLDTEAARKGLLSAAESDQASIRIGAIQLLQQGDFAEDRAYLSVLSQALKDADEQVRMAAVQGLAKADGPEEMSYLRALLHDPDPAIRIAVISKLGATDKSILSAALEDSDEAVSATAASLLQSENEQKK